MELPVFRYHPDPIGTGSIQASETECVCCGKARGYIYTGPVYSVEEYDEEICPWCIASGEAHNEVHATFTDEEGIGGYGSWDSVSPEVINEVANCTPGFSGWQQEQWWTHCNDAAAFLGVAGYKELHEFGDSALEVIRAAFSKETGLIGEDAESHLRNFDKQHGPSAYIFRCRHCQQLGGYWDCH